MITSVSGQQIINASGQQIINVSGQHDYKCFRTTWL